MRVSKEKIYAAFGQIDPALVKEAEPAGFAAGESPEPVRGWAAFLRSGWFAACVAVVLTLGIYTAVVLGSGGSFLHPSGGEPGIGNSSGITPADSAGSEGETQCRHENVTSRWVREPSCFHTGVMYLVCADCGVSQVRETDQLRHEYKNGFCSVCGLDERVDMGLWKYEEGEGLRYIGGDTPVELVVFPNVWERPKGSLPEEWNVMVLNEVPAGCFWGATGVRAVELPAEVLYLGDAAFAGCTSLERVELPSELQTIGMQAFYDCSSLREVVFPEKVRYIGSEAFARTTSLERIYFCSSKGEITIGESAFEGNGAVEMRPPDRFVMSGTQNNKMVLAGANLKWLLLDANNLYLAEGLLTDANTRTWFPALERIIYDGTCEELDGMLSPRNVHNLYWNLNSGTLYVDCTDGRYDPKMYPAG